MLEIANGAAGLEGKFAAIFLLDYCDLEEELILVLECPVPSVDLQRYTEVKGGSLQEEEARLIIRQLVEAALELQSKNIFHQDIKLENILIETGCFAEKTSLCRTFYGTLELIPVLDLRYWSHYSVATGSSPYTTCCTATQDLRKACS